MSGIKKATVSKNLNKALDSVRRGVEQCNKIADAANSVGREDLNQRSKDAQRVHDNVNRKLPEDIAPFVKGETAQWESILRRHDTAYENAVESTRSAEACETDVKAQCSQANQNLRTIERRVESLKRDIAGKDWYLDQENEEAKRLHREADDVLEQMRSNVSFAQKTQDARRKACSKLCESENLAQAAQREYDRLVNLAKDRQEKQRIAEKNQRDAMILDADLKSLRQDVESKNFKKFGAGLYTDSVKRELDAVKDLIVGRAYEDAIPRAQKLKERLNEISAEIESRQQAWSAAKSDAEKALSDARAELSGMDRTDIEVFSGLPKADLDALYQSLDDAARNISAESFQKASLQVAESIAKLRLVNESAVKNKNLAMDREDVANMVMQALCDCDYDTPNYYLIDEDDELSDLCVVAAAPGGVCDIKMRIDLNGNVSMEVANVPEGREQLCTAVIHNMQDKLAADDINFKMTDWGRAQDQNRVHLDITQRTQQVQKKIQRQG